MLIEAESSTLLFLYIVPVEALCLQTTETLTNEGIMCRSGDLKRDCGMGIKPNPAFLGTSITISDASFVDRLGVARTSSYRYNHEAFTIRSTVSGELTQCRCFELIGSHYEYDREKMGLLDARPLVYTFMALHKAGTSTELTQMYKHSELQVFS